jgi:hypothetical protein
MDSPALSERRVPRYRLYIDESGDHAFHRLDEPAHRYLALLGAWFREQDDYTHFADELERLKRRFFGPRPDDPVILHRSDIINRKRAFGILCDSGVRSDFDAALIQLVQNATFRLVCVVIDKKSHSEKYTTPFHPYHYCLAVMLDRYVSWLNSFSAQGDVMAESRGKEEDLQLKEAYKRVYESGTLWRNREQYQRALTSKDIKLERKRANIAGLQLADVLAYPVKQACLLERGLIDDRGDVFGKKLVEVAKIKFNRHPSSGYIERYGKVWL